MPDDDLPVRLPETVDYHGSGDNPLNHDEAFRDTTCPRCGGPARRETDTMDTFVDSSWYWYRYLSPDNVDGPVDRALVDRWTPVDQYTGGAEHAVMHLLYSRFWTKAMRDIGLVEQDEPFLRLFNQGQILGADGERMWKSRGNVQDPDELVRRYGADTVRLFLMFMGPWDQGGPWSPTGIGGVHRFLNRVWTLAIDPTRARAGRPGRRLAARRARTTTTRSATLRAAAHRTLRDVTADYEAFRFNTMVAKLMELSNTLFRYRGTAVAGGPAWDEAIRLLLLMLAPAAPHITEELWSRRAAAGGARVVVDPHRVVAGGRRRRDGRGDPRGPDPGQRQAARQADRRGRASAAPSSRPRRWPARRSRRSWPAGRPTRSSWPAAAGSSTSSCVATEPRADASEGVAGWSEGRRAAGEGAVATTPRSVRDGGRVELREVTRETVRAVCLLQVAVEQRGFVAPNAVSFAEAMFEPKAWFRAVVADDVPVGFVMLSVDPAAHEYYLWRFMIDVRYQSRGYGRAALIQVVEHVRTLPDATELLVSWVPAAHGPEPFYRAFGFEPTGEIDEGEVVGRLRL